jgi:hypothetical protein
MDENDGRAIHRLDDLPSFEPDDSTVASCMLEDEKS